MVARPEARANLLFSSSALVVTERVSFPTATRECLAKRSIWIVRLLSFGATMLLIMAWAGSSVVAQTTTPLRRVLVLYSDERLLPANVILDQAIRATFAAGTKNRIEFYSEFLDVARFPGEDQRQRDFFGDKTNPSRRR